MRLRPFQNGNHGSLTSPIVVFGRAIVAYCLQKAELSPKCLSAEYHFFRTTIGRSERLTNVDFQERKDMLVGLSIIGGLVAVLILLAVLFQSSQPAPIVNGPQYNEVPALTRRTKRSASNSARAAQSAPVPAAADPQYRKQPAIKVTVSAYQLWADYQANEVAADYKYKGKEIVVQGNVANIRKDFIENVFVSLATPNEFENIEAKLKEREAQAAAYLDKGEPIILRCRGAGMILGSPMLHDCEIIPEGWTIERG